MITKLVANIVIATGNCLALNNYTFRPKIFEQFQLVLGSPPVLVTIEGKNTPPTLEEQRQKIDDEEGERNFVVSRTEHSSSR